MRQLVARAVEQGMSALALTDTNGLYGAIPFYKAARAAGVHPILGANLDGTIILARNREGYARLCELLTYFLFGKKESKQIKTDAAIADLTKELQPHDNELLFVLTENRLLAKELQKREIEPLIAITHYGDRRSRYRADQLRQFALDRGLRPVAVNPIYFLDPPHARIHRVLSTIRLNTTLGNLKQKDVAHPDAWFRSPHEMERLYGDWPETLENAEWVVERCNVELPLGKPLFPEFPVPQNETPFSYLWKIAFEGLQKRYTPLRPKIIQRLQYELDIIQQLGFAPYFLIMWDIVRYAKREGIPVMGRGSAANSLAAYALGITRADPFKYDLYFERFLNLSRTDCPDIDLDICWRRRDAVIDYVYKTYGGDRVAMICTFNTFKARAAVREVAKAFGMPSDDVSRITRRLPSYGTTDIRAVTTFLPESRGLNIDEEPLKSIIDICEFIDGFPRHLSIHSGGVVIAPEPLTRFVPLQRATKGIVITQYDMGPIEDLGLIKMDLLGHRSLTVIADTIHKVNENRKIDIDIETLPDPDPLTGELLRTGQTIGCFQIESPAMRSLLQRTLTTDTDMLIKTIALVRPGASGSGMKKQFIDRRHGREETTYLHPSLEQVLSDTYGTMIYQEDVMKVAHVIAGMDLAEADALRRAMSKKRSPREMAKSMKTFLEKAAQNGIEESIAEEIWGLIANFAAYSYCKAHASSYGEVAYQCTYLKAHFPAEFLSSVLSNRGGFYHPAVYVQEARRMGIELRPPNVNRSQHDYTVEGEAIRVGFVEIRTLTQRTIEAILDQRNQAPFRSITDLCRRGHVPHADLDTLISAGACDSLGPTRPELLWELQALSRKPPRREPASITPAPIDALFSEKSSPAPVPQLPDYSPKHRLDQEWTALGLLASTHPLHYYLPALTERVLVLSREMQPYTGHHVTMVGWLIAERRVGLKERGCMKFLTLEDGCGVYEAVLFPSAYQRFGHLLDSHGPYFLSGEIQDENGYFSLLLDAIGKVESSPAYPVTPPEQRIATDT